jgi:hypothetical protein
VTRLPFKSNQPNSDLKRKGKEKEAPTMKINSREWKQREKVKE